METIPTRHFTDDYLVDTYVAGTSQSDVPRSKQERTMKKQIVTIVLGAVVMLGTATAVFAKPINDVAYGCDVFHIDCRASPTSR